MNRLRNPILAAAALLTLAFCVAPAPAQSAPDTFNLDFNGGTAVDYLDAVREAAGDVNIVVMEGVELFHMQPVQLKHVTTDAAVRLLDGLHQESDQRAVQLSVSIINNDGPYSWLYTVEASVRSATRPPVMTSHVWSLTNILAGDLAADDVLTAIETSLDLFGGAYARAEMRFHRETSLLIARGHPEQIQAISTVIDRLDEAAHQPGNEAKLRQLEEQAMMRIGLLESQLAESEQRYMDIRREAMEWQSRAEHYMRRIEALENEVNDLRHAMGVRKEEGGKDGR